VNEKTRQKNRLTACLKIFFPQILKWFDAVDSPLVAALLQRWGSLRELQGAHPGTLRKFFHQHNCRDEERIQERITGIQQALPATEDAAIVEGCSRRARTLVAVIETLRNQIEEYDRRIAELVASHPEGSLFGSLPGAGPVLTPRLIVAFGTQRERFASAEEMQRLSGIAPVTEKSGKSNHVHLRRACPKFCDRRSTNSPTIRWFDRDGRKPITTRREPRETITTRPSGPWVTNGFVLSTGVGKMAGRMMKRPTCDRYNAAIRHYSELWARPLVRSGKRWRDSKNFLVNPS